MTTAADSKDLKPNTRKEVAEIFGFPAWSTLDQAKRARMERLCPFQRDSDGKWRHCSKLSQHQMFVELDKIDTPFGACSVWHQGRGEKKFRPHIICPVRFSQDHIVFSDAAAVLGTLGSHEQLIVFEEVGLPLGRLDYILTAQANERIRAQCILEIMALSTTTTGHIIHSMFAALGMTKPLTAYKYGINFRQVVSRMIVQMIAKAHAAQSWETTTIWAIQDTLYDYLVNTTRLALPDVELTSVSEPLPPLLLFIYALVKTPDGSRFILQRQRVKGGPLQAFERMLIPRDIPSFEQLLEALKERQSAGHFTDITDLNAAASPPPIDSDS
jgi:hypothetical protein